MLEFEESYFQGEWRDGFFVEEMMKRAWASQLKMLTEIDAVCKKHGIRYFADWGTLLGAVRHKGFIPWDDDIDIAMLREDYDRFIMIAKEELPPGRIVGDARVNEDWFNIESRILNEDIIGYGEDRLKRWYGCPYMVGIDVFPLDSLPDESEEECAWADMLVVLRWFYDAIDEQNDPEKFEKVICQIEDMCKMKIDRTKLLKNQIRILMERVAAAYCGEKSDEITYLQYFAGNRGYKVKRQWYEESIWMPFENIMVPVPKHYDEILTVMYGDYRIPVRGSQAHEYPFYKKQQEGLELLLGKR